MIESVDIITPACSVAESSLSSLVERSETLPVIPQLKKQKGPGEKWKIENREKNRRLEAERKQRLVNIVRDLGSFQNDSRNKFTFVVSN